MSQLKKLRSAPLSLLGVSGLLAAVVLSAPGAHSALQQDDDLETTRAALEKWVEVRRILSQERRDWALGRQLLDDQVDMLQREVDAVRAKANEAEASIAEADKKRAQLVADNERLAQASAALTDRVLALEAGTRALLARAPDPIRERVKPLSQRMPDASGETRQSLSERFQNIVGILNEVNKFNNEISVTSEVRELPGGTSAEVTALYVGIGQGWYTTADGKAAGVGTAGPEGWTWSAANEAALEIARAVSILRNEAVADYVRLPVSIR